MFEPRQVTHLTFDCYGTLVDWETGILQALEPIFQAKGINPLSETILELYVKHEALLEAQAWQPYRDILRNTVAGIARDLRVALRDSELDLLPESIGSWPLFGDTVSALGKLKQCYRLIVLSNVDDSLFAATAKALQVPFDGVITAEQVRSYKPGEAHFREALRRTAVPANQILHVAQSLYHDHVPAKRLGFGTAWINRQSRLPNAGLAPACVSSAGY